MRCKKIRRLLSAYDDGELSVRQQCRVQAHLHRCPRCQAAYAAMQAAMWLVEQEVQLAEPPPHFAQSVMSALPSPHEMRRRAQWRVGGFAFSFLTTLAIVWGLFNFGFGISPLRFAGLSDSMPKPETRTPQPDLVASSALPPKPQLEEELIPRPTKKAAARATGTRRTPKTAPKRPLFVRHTAPKPPPPPEIRNPKPEPPLESSPAIVMVSLGAEVEQRPTAEVRTVSSPHVVRRPRLTAELTPPSWDAFPAADGGS
jgi:hypothetical protein